MHGDRIKIGGDSLDELVKDNQRFAARRRSHVPRVTSRAGFRWRASVLRGLERIGSAAVTGQPVTVVVPALYNAMPAETAASGWLNELETLSAIRHRIIAAANLTGWDVFTFHTLHNPDPFFASMLAAVRETWLKEGTLKPGCIAESLRRFGPPYKYNSIQPRLVENLIFQSCFMDWLKAKAEARPLRFHVIGTALIGALVSCRALSYESAVMMAVKVGARWDRVVAARAEDALHRKSVPAGDDSRDTLGWLRFSQVRQIIEGRHLLALGINHADLPQLDAPAWPIWFSATAEEEPVRLESVRDVRSAWESMNLKSWSPARPRPLPGDSSAAQVRGWLVSPSHALASGCRWSVYNYLLATPTAALLFLDHIATFGCPTKRYPEGQRSEPLPGIEDKAHRPLIRELHLHRRLKHSGGHRHS